MSTFSYVQGVVPKDEKYLKMEKIYDDCTSLGIKAPDEVLSYLDALGESCESGLLTELPEGVVKQCGDMEGCDVWEIDIEKVPKDIKKIRFITSY